MRVFPKVLLVSLTLAAGCGSKSSSLPDVKLPTLGGKSSASLASCPTKKCLTVVVAPWCGYCRAGTPMMLQARSWLADRDVAMRVVVGMAEEGSVREYAREFGPEALLDPKGAVRVTGGVPHFYVTNESGAILKEVAGMPMTPDVARFADYLGLP
jgi:hypothetical protein